MTFFKSEIGSGVVKSGGTPPPRIPGSNPPGLMIPLKIQLFREKLSENVQATIPILWVVLSSLFFNLKEWHKRPWTYVCEC